jgi:amidase
VKDNVAVAGVPMMIGSKLMEGYTPEFDATIITRVLDEGLYWLQKMVLKNIAPPPNKITGNRKQIRKWFKKNSIYL